MGSLLEDGGDIALGRCQAVFGFAGRDVQEDHDDGRLGPALTFPEGFDGLLAAAARRRHDDASRPFFQFLIGRLDVDHEVAIDFAQADHGACRQHVGDHLLGRAGFHARRARDDFRADDGAEVDVGTTADGRMRRTVDGDGSGSDRGRISKNPLIWKEPAPT